ncbi:MAG: FGGY-family carbohydrate kinase [Anaerolineales bacterium]|nr:FGGY-family carbohydrate kinase [Anaerolineales bacterium]
MGEGKDPVFLAVDLGTSSMKVALVTVSGRVLGWESEPLQLYMTGDGGVEQSPQEWWQAFLNTSTRLIRKVNPEKTRIKAVCCSTQGEGTIPVDRDGRALSNCVLWMDMRGAPHLKRHFKGILNVTGAGLLQTLRWIRQTGGMPSMTGKDPAAHMLLIRDVYPQIYENTFKFLNVLDYMNLKLTGRFTATFDSILTSWVTDNRDPDNIRYDPGLVNRSGIDREKFPEIVPCTEVLGPLLPEVANALCLGNDVQVVAGAIDSTAAAIGSGAVEDYLPHIYIGTSSWMAAHVPFKKTDIGASLASVPCAVPGKYLLIALQATAGGNLTFLRDKIIYNKDELLQEADKPDIFKVLDEIAERVPPGANGVIYTPWIWGERAPVEDKNLRAGLYNLSLHNDRSDIIRAFLEGIALNTCWLLEPVVKFLGRKPECIHIVGGGAQSDAWCRIFADVMQIRIKQVQDPMWANAVGAAWLAASGIGAISFEDIPDLIRFKDIYEPDPANEALYAERFDIFKQIYRRMKPVYTRLNAGIEREIQ